VKNVFRVIYRIPSGLHVMDEEFEDSEEAEAMAATLRERGFTDAAVYIDSNTADQTARAMAFTPVPVLGKVGYGNWRD
jgi:hypothetical protein